MAAEERGPAILTSDVRGAIVGEERVVFTQTMLVSVTAARTIPAARDGDAGQHARDDARPVVRDRAA